MTTKPDEPKRHWDPSAGLWVPYFMDTMSSGTEKPVFPWGGRHWSLTTAERDSDRFRTKAGAIAWFRAGRPRGVKIEAKKLDFRPMCPVDQHECTWDGKAWVCPREYRHKRRYTKRDGEQFEPPEV